MFKGLPLHTLEHSYTADTITKSELDESDLAAITDADFKIEGNTSVLALPPLKKEEYPFTLYPQTFSYMKSTGNYYTTRKNFASYLLLFTYEGAGVLEYEGQTYALESGDGFLIDCHKPHTYRTDGEQWVHSDLHFGGDFAAPLYRAYFENISPIFHYKVQEEYQRALEAVLHTALSPSTRRGLECSVKLQQLLLDILAQKSKSAHSREVIPYGVQTLQEYLGEHFREDVSLDEMVKISHTSKYYLIRTFKQHIGCTPKQYVYTLRIQHARNLLDVTSIPSCKVGELVGFPNEASFIAHFKKVVGMTPGEYRKR